MHLSLISLHSHWIQGAHTLLDYCCVGIFGILLLCRSPKLRALMREAIQLSDNLPVHQSSSIFVRQVNKH